MNDIKRIEVTFSTIFPGFHHFYYNEHNYHSTYSVKLRGRWGGSANITVANVALS